MDPVSPAVVSFNTLDLAAHKIFRHQVPPAGGPPGRGELGQRPRAGPHLRVPRAVRREARGRGEVPGQPRDQHLAVPPPQVGPARGQTLLVTVD